MATHDARQGRRTMLVEPLQDGKGKEFLQYHLHDNRFYYPTNERPRDARTLYWHSSCAGLSVILVIFCYVAAMNPFDLAFWPLLGNIAQPLIDWWVRLGN